MVNAGERLGSGMLACETITSAVMTQPWFESRTPVGSLPSSLFINYILSHMTGKQAGSQEKSPRRSQQAGQEEEEGQETIGENVDHKKDSYCICM